jgi:hypothetical protein
MEYRTIPLSCTARMRTYDIFPEQTILSTKIGDNRARGSCLGSSQENQRAFSAAGSASASLLKNHIVRRDELLHGMTFIPPAKPRFSVFLYKNTCGKAFLRFQRIHLVNYYQR